MFVWSPIPDQFAHMGSLEFAKMLIQETGVAVAPGVGFGEYGDQYIRLAFVENEQRSDVIASVTQRFEKIYRRNPDAAFVLHCDRLVVHLAKSRARLTTLHPLTPWSVP